jgi:hypothetical protein
MSETKLTRYWALGGYAKAQGPNIGHSPDFYLASDADARIVEQSQAHAQREAEVRAVVINANRRIADLERDHALIKEAALGERNLRLAAERERDELRKRVEELDKSLCRHGCGKHRHVGECTPPAAQGAAT